MVLTSGMIVFALVFTAVFATVMIWAYYSDWKRQQKYFKGSLKIILIIVAIWASLYFGVKIF